MTDLLLQTKLFMPLVRGALVPRTRLLERLGHEFWQAGGFSRQLTLVCAPAGYGKTTLVAAWLKQKAELFPVAWLSLDESDNDPARFLSYLLAAIQQIRTDFGSSTQALLQLPQPPPGAFLLTTFVNELSGDPTPFTLVLDDYHVIHTPAIHQQLSFLLDHQPPHMHLVLITREDPLLPIPRLRAKGLVSEIRQEDLQFTQPEMVDFLGRVMGLALTTEEIASLGRRTEGWIAGLQLAAIAMRSQLARQDGGDLKEFIQDFTGSSRFVMDYLIEEVFERQTVEMKDFLLKTSILERLSGSLCDALAERSESKEFLEHMEQANLFIVPLDRTRTWYRYHRLFAELLRHRLRSTRKPDEAALHQRASQWFASQGQTREAIHHALAAQDWLAAVALIGQACDELLKRGEIATLLGWFGKLPREVACADPQLCMAFAWAALQASQFEIAEPLLAHAENQAPPESHFLGQVLAAQAFLARARGDHANLIAKSERALSLLPMTDYANRGLVALNLGLAYWHAGRLDDAEPVLLEARQASEQVGNLSAALTAQIFLARNLAVRGKLRQAEAECRRIIQEVENIPILALTHFDLSAIYYEWNDLEKSGEHLRQGMTLSLTSGNAEFQNAGHVQQATIALALGDTDGAFEAVERSHTLARELNPITQMRSAACHVQLALARGDLEMAAQWAEQVKASVDAHSFYRFLGLTQARLLIANGQKEAAARQLAEQFEIAARAGWGYAMIAVRILQSLAADTLSLALPFLTDALRMGQPEGFTRSFVDAGRGIIPLLQEAARRGMHPSYAGQILAALGSGHTQVASGRAQLVEPLSERELEVLRLVTAGLSNRQIARKLVISPGTAKTHIHNLCGKLGAHNRTEAAMRAKELELV